MLFRATHFGHDGWQVCEVPKSKKQFFVFADTMGFGGGTKRDVVVLQVLRPIRRKVIDEEGKEKMELDFNNWHFAKHYKPPGRKGEKPKGILERVIGPPVLAREIAQALMNCVDGEKTNVPVTEDQRSKELEEAGV